MECYFAIAQLPNTNLILDEEDKYHIQTVLRHQINDEVVVIYQTQKYRTRIIKFQPTLICQIIETIKQQMNELPVKVTLVMALLKEQKFDDVIKKAVELGVYQIVPIQLTRSISVLKDQKQIIKKVQRWQNIAKAAAKQANRNLIPVVHPVVQQLTKLKIFQSDLNYVAHEKVDHYFNWSSACLKHTSITVIIGPEGGLTEQEVTNLQTLGFQPIALGPTILRAETAPLYFLSVINYTTTQLAKEE